MATRRPGNPPVFMKPPSRGAWRCKRGRRGSPRPCGRTAALASAARRNRARGHCRTPTRRSRRIGRLLAAVYIRALMANKGVAGTTRCRAGRQDAASRQASSRLLRCAPALRVTRPNVLTHRVFMAGSELPATSRPICENTSSPEVNPHILCSPFIRGFSQPPTDGKRKGVKGTLAALAAAPPVSHSEATDRPLQLSYPTPAPAARCGPGARSIASRSPESGGRRRRDPSRCPVGSGPERMPRAIAAHRRVVGKLEVRSIQPETLARNRYASR